MRRLDIVDATPVLVGRVSDRLRHADAVELAASSGMEPAQALAAAYLLSGECKCALADGVPLALLGVDPLGGGAGAPWMVGTTELEKYPRQLLVQGRELVSGWLERFSILVNFVHAENARSIAYLYKLGFTIDEQRPHGPLSAPFHPFYRRACLCVDQQ